MNIVSEVEMQYYNVLKILIDPELEPLKSRITVIIISNRCSSITSPSILKVSKIISGSVK